MHVYLRTDNYECRYNEDHTDGSLRWESHCHDEFEIIYILESGVNLVYEGRSYRCEKGQLMVIPPLTYHSVTADPDNDYKRIGVSFAQGLYPDTIEKKLTENAGLCPVLSSPILQSIVSELQKVFISKDINDYIQLVESLITQTVYHYSEETRKEETAVQDEKNELLERAVRYIDEHFCEKILLDKLAASLFISKSTLCHLFSEQMQISPKRYILQKKMAYASMLIDNGMSITAAARAVGYENYSNFYRIYKKLKTEKQL